MSTVNDREMRVEAGLAQLRAGKMVILVDDEDRENEGDLTMAAEKITPEAINFMAKWGRGLICLTLTEERAVGDAVNVEVDLIGKYVERLLGPRVTLKENGFV